MKNDLVKKGIFITFEGPDGSGKTTVLKKIFEFFLKQYPNKVFLTREPGGQNNAIAEDIRDILLNKHEYKMCPMTEALLFAASRAQHVNDFIKPHLINDDIVFCDRYIHSSLIYQGYARGLGFEEVMDINKKAIDGIMPDLTFVLMVSAETGMNRIKLNSKREVNRLDKESIQMHNKVYEGYKKLIEKYDNLIIIDANRTIEEIFCDVKKLIEKYLGQKRYDR